MIETNVRTERGIWRRILRAIAWDGMLPLIVLAVVIGTNLAWPKVGIMRVLIVVGVPILAALFRAAIAYDQLERVCAGSIGVLRQLGVALAIVLLFVFEIFASMLSTVEDEPPEAWLVPAGCYLAYLIVITAALSPAAPCAAAASTDPVS